MKKLWVAVKRGFILDPKHRAAMGECVYLYLYILDMANWDDGVLSDWKDEAAASDMSMPVRTLREQRRKLEAAGYITCRQGLHRQEIVVHNWTNPREYSGEVYNLRNGDSLASHGDTAASDDEGHGDTHGYTHGDTHGSSQGVSPTSSSNATYQKSELSSEEIAEANKKVDAMLEVARKVKYEHRELIPETLVELADVYVEATGQRPSKKSLHDWIATFSEWQGRGASARDLRQALERAGDKKHGFFVVRPGSLTNTLFALMGKRESAVFASPQAVETDLMRFERERALKEAS